MQGSAFIFFALFALVIAGMYLAIRRQWAAPGMVAGVGVLLSIIFMMLMSLSQGNAMLQALLVGILVGGLFSGATLAIAWYFHSNEMRARYLQEQAYQQSEATVGEDY
jgi:hypothetical protein